MAHYVFPPQALPHLKTADAKLYAAIKSLGPIKREVNPDIFSALCSSIISQQISGAAATTVWNRLSTLLTKVTPQNVLSVTPETIKSCGMSMRKANYLYSAAQHFASGQIDAAQFARLPDDDIIKELTGLPGVGVWTAEMLLVFSLQRPNVISFGDFGIRKGMMRLYGLESLTRPQFDTYAAKYAPYATVASLYLWEIAGQK